MMKDRYKFNNMNEFNVSIVLHVSMTPSGRGQCIRDPPPTGDPSKTEKIVKKSKTYKKNENS